MILPSEPLETLLTVQKEVVDNSVEKEDGGKRQSLVKGASGLGISIDCAFKPPFKDSDFSSHLIQQW